MKKNLVILFLTLIAMLIAGPFSSAQAALMTDYCQNPPLIPQPIDPNILFVLDTSGSMDWCAYYTAASSTHPCDYVDSNSDLLWDSYNPNTGYEGYFDPEQFYTLVSGVYQENPSPGSTCVCTCTTWSCQSSNAGGCDPKGTHGCSSTRYACCTAKTCTGACDYLSGNYLNYAHMHRIDLLRWAMTGGSPSTCSSTNNTPDKCDPELYASYTGSGQVGTVCNDTLAIDGASKRGGCILQTDDLTQVKVPWTRVRSSLAYEFSNLELRPRMGAMLFNTSGPVNNQLVYIGDATTAANTVDLNYPYKNLITKVNATSATGGTPTGPAMWDAYNYFAQNNAQYGGFAPMAVGSTTTRWKNPMYVCDQTGLSCTFVPCAGNYVILLSDGQWNTNGSGNTSCTIGSSPSCSSTSSADPVISAYCMHKGFTNKSAVPAWASKVSAVYTIALFPGKCSSSGELCNKNADCPGGAGDTCQLGTGAKSLDNVAMYGSFDNNLRTWPGGTTDFPAGTCSSMTDCTVSPYKGSGCTAIPASAPDWDKNGDGVPDTFYSASNALQIKDSIITAILEILQQATSGTAVSILASGEGNGANLIQAFFYPRKSFMDTDITWIGEMQNLWYYLDPKLQVSTIREDTDLDSKLELKNDYVIHFRFDTALNKTRVDLSQDVNGDGSSMTFVKTVDIDQTKNLWEAGKTLWARNLSTSPRTLYTTTNGSSLLNFSTSNAATLKDYLQAATNTEATNIINYIGGTDLSGSRERTASIDLNANGVVNSGETNVWKLGDIISSTPKTESWVRLNTYDSEAPNGYGDSSYWKFINSADYDVRGMVYVGANDGMLHAFNFGITDVSNNISDKFEIAHLRSTSNLGKEMWAYIPKNALPYLKYLMDPNYCHLFYTDVTPYIFDASINMPSDCSTGDYATCPKKTVFTKDGSGNDTHNVDFSKTSWKTVLIGGMGVGGACRAATGTCATGSCSATTSTSCTINSDCPSGESCLPNCVKTPIMDPSDNTKGLGYSSYYALDVTDPQNPTLLWEFSNPALGFSTSGPAVMRIGDGTQSGKNKNGNWYVVFASGPTGPINTGLRQFMGKSDQNLKLFIVNLKTGALVRTIDTGLANAFAGSLKNATLDVDRWRTDRVGNYSDDVLYFGYTQRSGTNWVGGVLRLTTGGASGESKDVSTWNVSTVISGIGPVTASVPFLMDRTSHRLWLYFGTGRYFYKVGTLIDDQSTQQKLYGVKEPCYSATDDKLDLSCTTSVSGLTDATTTTTGSEPANGWYINLDPAGTDYVAERVISNPLAAFTGGVFFSTFAPTSNICGYNGKTYLWAVNYATGGVAPSSAFVGTALIQISTGEIKEVPLATALTLAQGKKGDVGSGITSKEGFSVITSPKPVKKILHMQER